jgi:hypothetical protein
MDVKNTSTIMKANKIKCLEILDLLQKLAINGVCTTLLVILVIQCITRFGAKNTGTGDKYSSMNQVIFPEMSFCNLEGYKLNNSDLINGYLNDYRWIPDAVNVSLTGSEYYSKITYSKYELLSRVQVSTRNKIIQYNNTTKVTMSLFINPPITRCGNEAVITTKPHYNFGECTILTLPKCLLEASPTEINLEFRKDVIISLYYPSQFIGETSAV